MSNQMSVHHATYDLLRRLGLTTVFGNPGSTEQTFLRDFPTDFTYVLALQESSVVAMADAFAQMTGRPARVNVHTAAGMGNAMGSLVAAYHAHTPLIVTAGQQHREMVITEPYLTNRDETLLPRHWVKWAYQPVRAQDVPAAFMRAYAVATQPPAGPGVPVHSDGRLGQTGARIGDNPRGQHAGRPRCRAAVPIRRADRRQPPSRARVRPRGGPGRRVAGRHYAGREAQGRRLQRSAVRTGVVPGGPSAVPGRLADDDRRPERTARGP